MKVEKKEKTGVLQIELGAASRQTPPIFVAQKWVVIWRPCLAIFALLLSACGPSYVFEETQTLAESGWGYQDTLNYNFQIPDTSTIYDLHLILEHSDEFASQNTYLRLKLRFPDGQRTDEQLSIQFADQFGSWLGDCSGDQCSLNVPIQTGAFFNQSGDYQLTVEQFSREESLQGIKTMTFALSKHMQ